MNAKGASIYDVRTQGGKWGHQKAEKGTDSGIVTMGKGG